MIVISDASPLTALLTIGAADVLTELFTEVVVRSHPQLPNWLRVESVKNSAQAQRYAQTVDLGEAEAIALAKELDADRLLIDERKGRRLAVQEGVRVVGP